MKIIKAATTFKTTPEEKRLAKRLRRDLEARVGQLALDWADDFSFMAPLSHLSGWTADDALHFNVGLTSSPRGVLSYAHIEVEAPRAGSSDRIQLITRLDFPDAIVRGRYFNLTPGEYAGNLYPVLSAISVAMARSLIAEPKVAPEIVFPAQMEPEPEAQRKAPARATGAGPGM